MRPDPVLQFRLGLAAIGVIVVIALIAAFAPGLLDNRQTATVVLDRAWGLSAGAPVLDDGFLIGHITEIQPDLKRRRYVVTMRLTPEWQPEHPEQLGLVVQEPNPLKSALLSVVRDVNDASACPKLMGIDSSLPGMQMQSCGHQPGMIEKALAVLDSTQQTVNSINTVLAVFVPPKTIGPNGQMVAGTGTTEATSNLLDTLHNVKDISDSVKGLLDTKNTKQIEDVIARLTKLSQQVNSTAADVNGLVTKSAKPMAASLADARYILAITATQMSSITNDLQASASNLRELTAQLRDDPGSPLRPRKLSDPSILSNPR